MLDNKILELLKPFRIKLYFKKLIEYLSYSILAFSIITFGVMVLSKIVPITFIWQKIAIVFLLSLIGGTIWSFYKKPTYKETAKVIDSFELKERVATSLELIGDTSDISIMQKNDTLEKLKESSLKNKIVIKPSQKILLITFTILICATLVGFIETSTYKESKQLEQSKMEIKKKEKKIDELIEKVENDKKLALKDKKEIKSNLKKLKSTINRSKDLKEAQKNLLKSKKDMKKIGKDLANKKLKNIGENLSKKEITKDLGEQLKKKGLEDIKKDTKKLENKLKNSNKEELKKSSKEMKELAESLKENKELSELLKKISQDIDEAIESGDLNKLSSKLNDIGEKLANALANDIDLGSVDELVSEIDGVISDLQNNSITNNSSKQNNQTNSESNSSNEGNDGNNQGNGQGGGGTSKNGGSGQGAGAGSGQGGGRNNTSTGIVKDYEKIFTPKNSNKNGHDAQVKVNKNNTGDSKTIQTKKLGDEAGDSIPYNEVLNSYKQSEFEKMETKEIPQAMKNVIKKYFTELE
ncbi:hypothetical protein CLPU_9c00470 [Gottschalkia purinilytica]|uniref:Uncharacterized protein n=1 Tax=Gottschalkia purinilytica TaxID=1503 RepID=A0A0L0W9N1_GOTPU|nr:hypothetical protein [Gottschalkia purinilytica]KNF08151.1 hypothetical protein CLPU_9c00470 [Gottschalkia purinilytica]